MRLLPCLDERRADALPGGGERQDRPARRAAAVRVRRDARARAVPRLARQRAADRNARRAALSRGVLDQSEVARLRAGENPLELRVLEPVHPRKEPAQHAAVFIEHCVVAVLEKRLLPYRDLIASDAAAANAAA